MVGQWLNSPSFGCKQVDSCEKDLVVDVYLHWIINKLVNHIKNTRLVSKCSTFFLSQALPGFTINHLT